EAAPLTAYGCAIAWRDGPSPVPDQPAHSPHEPLFLQGRPAQPYYLVSAGRGFAGCDRAPRRARSRNPTDGSTDHHGQSGWPHDPPDRGAPPIGSAYRERFED